MSQEEIIRLHERLDAIEKTQREVAERLSERIKAIEIWQAFQMGRLSMVGLFCAGIGALVMAALRHWKVLGLLFVCAGLALISGCAASSSAHPNAVTVSAKVAMQATSKAKVSTQTARAAVVKAKTQLVQVQETTENAPEKAALSGIGETLDMALAQLTETHVQLIAAEAASETAATETVKLQTDRDDALAATATLTDRNVRLTRRLNIIAILLALAAGLLAHSVCSKLADNAYFSPILPPWWRLAGPVVVGIIAGGIVFGFLRYAL